MFYDLWKIWKKLGIFVTLHPMQNESNTLRIFEMSKYKRSIMWLYWEVEQLIKIKDKRTTSTDQKKFFHKNVQSVLLCKALNVDKINYKRCFFTNVLKFSLSIFFKHLLLLLLLDTWCVPGVTVSSFSAIPYSLTLFHILSKSISMAGKSGFEDWLVTLRCLK